MGGGGGGTSSNDDEHRLYGDRSELLLIHDYNFTLCMHLDVFSFQKFISGPHFRRFQRMKCKPFLAIGRRNNCNSTYSQFFRRFSLWLRILKWCACHSNALQIRKPRAKNAPSTRLPDRSIRIYFNWIFRLRPFVCHYNLRCTNVTLLLSFENKYIFYAANRQPTSVCYSQATEFNSNAIRVYSQFPTNNNSLPADSHTPRLSVCSGHRTHRIIILWWYRFVFRR